MWWCASRSGDYEVGTEGGREVGARDVTPKNRGSPFSIPMLTQYKAIYLPNAELLGISFFSVTS